MNILAFESSCDETSAAVVSYENGVFSVKSNIIASQVETHRLYGGVVPEIASRAHTEAISRITYEALETAGVLALLHTALYKNVLATGLYKRTGARNLVCRAQKCQFHSKHLPYYSVYIYILSYFSYNVYRQIVNRLNTKIFFKNLSFSPLHIAYFMVEYIILFVC